MIILDNVNRSLSLVLAGVVAANQLPFVVSYVDLTLATYGPLANHGQSNDTSSVTVVAAPAASTQRQIKHLSITNSDTANATVSVRYTDSFSGTNRIIHKIILAPDSTLEYNDGTGWKVIDKNGNILTSSGSASGGTPGGSDTQVQFNDAGVFGGDSGLVFDKTNNILTLLGLLDLSGAAAGQIKFPASGNLSSDANTLDYYKEGSWTPTDASGAGLTLTVNQTCLYVRIGSVVFAACDISYPVTASGANAAIGGLPFTAAFPGAMVFGRIGNATLKQGQITATTTQCQLYDGTGNNITNASQSGSLIRACFLYFA